MVASAKKFPRGSPDNRTTEKHVFKPPEDGGTVSQTRADRWQNASSQGPVQTSSRSPSSPPLSPPTQTRKRVQTQSMVRLPAPERPPPVAAPMANDGLNLRKVKPPPELADDWYPTAPLNPEAGKHGPADILGARSGMSHPPQNPKVRKKLLAYLHARQVPHTVELRKIKSPSGKSVDDSSMNFELDISQDGGRDYSSASGFGSQHSTPHHGQKGHRMAKSSSMPNMKAEWSTGDTHGRKKVKLTESSPTSWLDSLQEDQKKARPPPSEDEVYRKSEDLKRHSRFHGFELGKVPARELATLAVYHNEVTRRHFPNSKHQAGATAGQKLRELRNWCIEQVHDEHDSVTWEDQALHSASLPEFLEGPKLVRPLYYEDCGPLAMAGKASPKRLRQVAEQMKHNMKGPNRLQFMSRASGMSVITGARMKDSDEDL